LKKMRPRYIDLLPEKNAHDYQAESFPRKGGKELIWNRKPWIREDGVNLLREHYEQHAEFYRRSAGLDNVARPVKKVSPPRSSDVLEHCSRPRREPENLLNDPLMLVLIGSAIFTFMFLGYAVYSLNEEDRKALERRRIRPMLEAQYGFSNVIESLYQNPISPLCPSEVPPCGAWTGTLGEVHNCKPGEPSKDAKYSLTFNQDGSLHGTRVDESGSFMLCGTLDGRSTHKQVTWAEYKIHPVVEEATTKGDTNQYNEFLERRSSSFPHVNFAELPVAVVCARLIPPENESDEDAAGLRIDGTLFSCSGIRRFLKLDTPFPPARVHKMLAVCTVGEPGWKLALLSRIAPAAPGAEPNRTECSSSEQVLTDGARSGGEARGRPAAA